MSHPQLLSGGTWVDNVIKGAWQNTVYGDGFVMNVSWQQILKVNNESGPYFNQSILGIWSPLMAVTYIKLLPLYDSTANAKELLKIKHAIECVLSPCVKTHNMSVSKGVPSIQTSSPEFGEIYYLGNDSILSWELMQVSEIKDRRNCWKLECGALVNVSLTEDNWPPKSILWKEAKFAGCPVAVDPSSWLTGALTTSKLYNNTDQTWIFYSETSLEAILQKIDGSNFADVMRNIAASMTKYARDISNQTVQGIVYVPQVYVSVDWAFLALPGLIIVLGVIFFLLTISINSKHELGLWKSSILPAIFHGLPEGMTDHEYSTASAMERKAQQATVKLEVSNSEKRLLLRK